MPPRPATIYPIPTATVSLHVGPAAIVDEILGRYNHTEDTNKCSAQLRFIYLYVHKALPEPVYNEPADQSEMTPDDIRDILCVERKSEKALRLMAMFLSDVRNIFALTEAMSSGYRALWRKAIEEGSVKGKEVFRFIRHDRPDNNVPFYSHSWFEPIGWYSNYYYSRHPSIERTSLCIDPALRKYVIYGLYRDRLLDIKALERLPDGLSVFSDEEGALNAVARFDAIKASGLYTYKASKYALKELVALQQAMELKEFFPLGSEDRYRRFVRTRIMALLFQNFGNNGETGGRKPHEVIAAMSRPCAENRRPFVREALLPNIYGKYNTDCADLILTNLFGYVRDVIADLGKTQGWIPVTALGKICDLLLRTDQDLFQISYYTESQYARASSPGSRHTYFYKSDYTDFIYRPIMQGTLFTLAGLGMLELAYRPDAVDTSTFSPFCGAEFWRLTQLGRWVFGIEKEYNVRKETGTGQDFILDDRLPVIMLARADAPMRSLLDKFASPISAMRYRVTPATFLAGCNRRSDIEAKIALFKDFICAEPPQNWLDFFDTMLRQAVAVRSTYNKRYIPFDIDPADRELQQLLTTDSKLGEVAVCARGFRVFVYTGDIVEFRRLMASHGYLVDPDGRPASGTISPKKKYR